MKKPVKTETLFIRCTLETYKRFRVFASNFKNYEDALIALLDLAERYGHATERKKWVF